MGKNSKDRDRLELTGVIIEAYKGGMFNVEIDKDQTNYAENNEVGKITILATVCGKMRQNFIKLIVGDSVRLEISPYDTTKGRITLRLKECIKKV